jgi:predicted nucleic acid-binding protein
VDCRVIAATGAWSRNALKRAAENGVLFINPLIFAEVCVGFARREDAVGAMDALDFQYADLPWDAAFLTGRSFAEHRRRDGAKRSPLPDFYIVLGGMTLLTRDATRYRSYFPKRKLVSPETS